MIREALFNAENGVAVISICALIILICIECYVVKITKSKELDIKFTLIQRAKILIPIIVLMVYASIYAISLMQIYDTPYDYQKDKPANSVEYLVGLNDNAGVRGNIRYLGRGYIESNMYYNYMVDCGSYMKQNQLNATINDIRIIVSATERPRIEWRTKTRISGPFYWEEPYWNIYVPENAIDDTISIDMK